MPLYDLMLLLDPAAPGDRHDSILKDVQGLVENGGKLVTTQEWGVRRMTFEINHQPEADYHLLQFEAPKGGELLEQLDHSLKIMDGVLRHRIIRMKDGSAPPPVPRPEGRREAPDSPEPAHAETPEGVVGDSREVPPSPEQAEPAAAPATAGSAAAGIPAAPADEPAPAPAETPPPPDTAADQEAGPAGGGGDDEAPSGPTAA